MSPGRIAYGAAALLAAASVAYAGWSSHQKRTDQAAIAAAVSAGARALSGVLGDAPSPAQADEARAAEEALQAVPESRQREMARAADEYLAGVHAIAQRRLDAVRLAAQAQASREALQAHLASSERRGAGWIGRAAELKRRADQDQADLERVLGALADNLDSLAQPEAVLAARMDPAQLVPASLREAAAARARAESKASGEALARATRTAHP